MPILESKSDKVFHAWAADVAQKYPQLFNSYKELRECWYIYHPETTTGEE